MSIDSTLPTAGTSLAGRGVVVTGGNRGIGLGLAQGCALAGASVVIWGRDDQVNAQAVRTLRALSPQASAEIHAVRCDVGDPDAVTAAFAASVHHLGAVHAVLASAGVSSVSARFHEHTDAEWDRVFRVNVHGLRWTMQQAVQHMVGHGQGGALLGVASMAGRHGMRTFAPYAASKGAVIALMNSLALEYARKGIRANSLLPGFTDTEMTSEGGEAFHAKVIDRTPAHRYGLPSDFARMAAFLADPGLSFHTADEITVDGGYGHV